MHPYATITKQNELRGDFMEIWDAYLKDGTKAGKDLIRGEEIPKGLYHLVCEIIVRHEDGDYLLMQRDPRKPNFDGMFEATAGGSALKGETPLTCAKRELTEETGIIPLSLEEISVFVSHNTIYHNFLAITDCDKSSITLQEGETVSFKWLNEQDFAKFVNSDQMIEAQRIRYMPYLEKMGYIHTSP